jgi:hypothetical protein
MRELHGDQPSGPHIVQNLERASTALPPRVEIVDARADSGSYCCEGVEA